ncbi:hypothetical protein KEM52_003270 [Ascosphaera acerosa]|nr:hypothetical protein KEM52_003270 [Ascosphaera acerosa]
MIDRACAVAAHLASLVDQSSSFRLVSENPPPCLQVCFYYAPLKQLVWPAGEETEEGVVLTPRERGRRNSAITEAITRALVPLGFMLDFAPPSGGDAASEGDGKFFRCVVNGGTKPGTVEALLRAIQDVGANLVPLHRPDRVIHGLPEPMGAPHESVFKKNPFLKRGPVKK